MLPGSLSKHPPHRTAENHIMSGAGTGMGPFCRVRFSPALLGLVTAWQRRRDAVVIGPSPETHTGEHAPWTFRSQAHRLAWATTRRVALSAVCHSPPPLENSSASMYLDEKEPTIIRSAYRHGVGSDDILHAYRHPLWTGKDNDLRVVVGPDRVGNLLELEVATGRTQQVDVIVHAMRVRAKYLRRVNATNASRDHRSRRRTR
jgi:hypothetical protein